MPNDMTIDLAHDLFATGEEFGGVPRRTALLALAALPAVAGAAVADVSAMPFAGNDEELTHLSRGWFYEEQHYSEADEKACGERQEAYRAALTERQANGLEGLHAKLAVAAYWYGPDNNDRQEAGALLLLSAFRDIERMLKQTHLS